MIIVKKRKVIRTSEGCDVTFQVVNATYNGDLSLLLSKELIVEQTLNLPPTISEVAIHNLLNNEKNKY